MDPFITNLVETDSDRGFQRETGRAEGKGEER